MFFVPLLLIILFIWMLRLIGIFIDRRQLSSDFGKHAYLKVTEEIPAQMREHIRIIQADSATEEEKDEHRENVIMRFTQFSFDLGAIAAFVPDLKQAASWDILKIAHINMQSGDYEALMGNIDTIIENVQRAISIYRPE